MYLILWFSIVVAGATESRVCGEWVRVQVPQAKEPIRDLQIHLDAKGDVHAMWYAPQTGITHAAGWNGDRWHIDALGRGRGDMDVVDNIPYVALADCDVEDCVVSYGWREGGEWSIREAVRVTGPLSAPSLRLGPDGQPHLAYGVTVGDASMIMHASTPHGAWFVSEVYAGSTHLGPPDLSVRDAGTLDLVFTDTSDGGRILYGVHKKAKWQVSETSLARGRAARLVWGPIDAPYIGYFRQGQRVAVRTPDGQWVDYGTPHKGTGPFDIDIQGAPHFLLTVDAPPLKRLEWVRWTGTEWTRELIAVDPQGFSASALALNASGCPLVLYQHTGAAKTVFARAGL